MKKFNTAIVMLMGLLTLDTEVAKADFVAGRIRTVQNAMALTQVDDQGQVIRRKAIDLTAQKMDGSKSLRSFKLTSLIVPKCIMGKCPMPFPLIRTFEVYLVTKGLDENEVHYLAIEKASIDESAPGIPAQLIVIENTKTHEILLTVYTPKEGEKDARNYVGTYEDLIVTQ